MIEGLGTQLGEHAAPLRDALAQLRMVFVQVQGPPSASDALMPSRIEDYALIGDTQTVALVADDGSIDWLCAPRFDSGACFAALLGTEDHGHWRIGPVGGGRAVRRRYRPNTLVLETEFEGDGGTFRIVDCMPIRDQNVDVVRLVEGVEGEVEVEVELKIRFDYGSVVPWVESLPDGLRAVGGPDALALHTPVRLEPAGMSHVARFTVRAGEVVPFALTWYPSHHRRPNGIDAQRAVDRTTAWWEHWSARSTYDGEWADLVQPLGDHPQGAHLRADRRDRRRGDDVAARVDRRRAQLGLPLLLAARRHVLALRAHERRLRRRGAPLAGLAAARRGRRPRRHADHVRPGRRAPPHRARAAWLPGYEGSAPVRIGNAASDQFQLDVYGEVADALHSTLRAGIPAMNARTWPIEARLLDFLETPGASPTRASGRSAAAAATSPTRR